MRVGYEEKTYESYFNNELNSRSGFYFPFGQVQEGIIGADAAAFSSDNLFWRMFALLNSTQMNGVNLNKIAQVMSKRAKQSITGIPAIDVNLLFQYKRPEYIARSNGAEWGSWNAPYYRYDIYKEQQLLLEEIDQKFGANLLTIYASPSATSITDLVTQKQSNTVIVNSNLCRASSLAGHHRNTYSSAGNVSIAFSEPEHIPFFDLFKHVESRTTPSAENNIILLENLVNGLKDVLLSNDYFSEALSIRLRDVGRLHNYPILYHFAFIRIFKELTGLQWVAHTRHA